MRVALAGKGGAGKTTIAATLARLAARGGRPVVAVDADSNPNLAAALGGDGAAGGQPAVLPPRLVSRRRDGPALTATLDEVLQRWAVPLADGVRLLHMGAPDHAEEGCRCAAHAVVGAVLHDLGERASWLTVVDMEASPEHLSRGTARHVDCMLFVTEAYYRSLETVRRLALLAGELPIPRLGVVANKVRSAADADAVRDFCARHDLPLVGAVPWSDAVVDADVRRVPLLDAGDATPAAAVIAAVGRDLGLIPSR